jgi:hypothetical protein
MKKAIVAIASALVVSSAFAQGTIKLENNNTIKPDGSGTYKIPFYADVNANGVYDAGTDIGIGTYAAQNSTTASMGLFTQGSTTPFATALFRSDANGAFLGTPSTQTVQVPGAAPGTTPTLVAGVWLGSDFNAATIKGTWTFTTARPLGGDPGGGATPILPSGLAGLGDPVNSTGLLVSVPEPSTIALGVLGVGALLLRRRK